VAQSIRHPDHGHFPTGGVGEIEVAQSVRRSDHGYHPTVWVGEFRVAHSSRNGGFRHFPTGGVGEIENSHSIRHGGFHPRPTGGVGEIETYRVNPSAVWIKNSMQTGLNLSLACWEASGQYYPRMLPHALEHDNLNSRNWKNDARSY
jgi:hypothetical protein